MDLKTLYASISNDLASAIYKLNLVDASIQNEMIDEYFANKSGAAERIYKLSNDACEIIKLESILKKVQYGIEISKEKK